MMDLPLTSASVERLGRHFPNAISAAKKVNAPPTQEEALEISNADMAALNHMINEVTTRFTDELGTRLILFVPLRDSGYYEQQRPLFGDEVEAKLPTVSEDIAEAGKCLATARYTASVFHLMRALETGTATFAGILGVHPIDGRGRGKNWQNFLDEANAAIRGLPSQDERSKRYAAISSNLYHVKLAWRNEVMHPKQTYTEEEAFEVFAASKAFMRELASVL
jgi:hypothetical protein